MQVAGSEAKYGLKWNLSLHAVSPVVRLMALKISFAILLLVSIWREVIENQNIRILVLLEKSRNKNIFVPVGFGKAGNEQHPAKTVLAYDSRGIRGYDKLNLVTSDYSSETSL